MSRLITIERDLLRCSIVFDGFDLEAFGAALDLCAKQQQQEIEALEKCFNN